MSCVQKEVRGFTLIELLTVIAIIAILAGILIPTSTAARVAAKRARTRVQFSQWAAAIETFRQEYGFYPQFATGSGAALLNAEATTDSAGDHFFHDVLAGRRRNGSGLEGNALEQNSRRIRFVAFAETDFVRAADVAEAQNLPGELNLIRDAFHNTSIAVIVDANLDGIINALDAPSGVPAVVVPGTSLGLRPALGSDSSQGVHASVIFYSAPPGATSAADLLATWR